MNLWNIKNLESPPVNTYKVKTPTVDITTLKAVLQEALDVLKNQKLLNQEAALLSRCIYRMKSKFRSDKGLKAMEKMNRGLLLYLRMNIRQTVQAFYEMIPENYTRNTYLPTLDNLQYLLVRLQGLSKLLVRIVEASKVAAEFMQLRVNIGHLWKVAFVCFSVVSRVFVLARDLLEFCCRIYSQVLPFAESLENVGGFNWLPVDYSFPDNLKVWLDINWLDQAAVEIKPSNLNVPTIFNIVESDSDVEFCGKYLQVDEVETINESMVVEVKEEEADDSVKAPKRLKKVGGKNKIKVKQEKLNREVQEKESAEKFVNNIQTLKDLRKLSKNFEFIKRQNLDVFKKLDRMQSNLLCRSIKEWTVKAKKHSNNIKAASDCVEKVRELLRASLT